MREPMPDGTRGEMLVRGSVILTQFGVVKRRDYAKGRNLEIRRPVKRQYITLDEFYAFKERLESVDSEVSWLRAIQSAKDVAVLEPKGDVNVPKPSSVLTSAKTSKP